MRIAIGADHRGYEAAQRLSETLRRQGHEVTLHGDCSGRPCDYPDQAYEVGRMVADGKADLGVLLCGSGIGMGIAANKIPGIRAAVVHDEFTAQLSRSHNNANILCMSADLLGQKLIEKIVDVWLRTPFEGGRHARRVLKIAAIEEGRNPATATG